MIDDNKLALALNKQATFLAPTPQVHVHYLTSEKEAEKLGHGIVELCCHGCDEAWFVKYIPATKNIKFPVDGLPELKETRDSFQARHKNCPNKNYETSCPNERDEFYTLDMTGSVMG